MSSAVERRAMRSIGRRTWTAAIIAAVMAIGMAIVPGAAANAAPGDLAHGVVTVDSNKNGAVDSGPTGSNDTPLAGVKVTLRGSNPDNPGVTKTTAADGSWSFTAADAAAAAPGPYTVTIDAGGVNGNAYLTPLSPTPGVNDFTRVSGNGNTQKSVSASIPTDAADIALNALVYPTWSTDITSAADPNGYEGNAIYTGTTPFDTDDSKAGWDSGASNNRVRTGDVINYNWTYTVDAEQDLGSQFNAMFEQTITLQPGAVATFGQYPAVCGGVGTITALPSGTVLAPRVDPPAGTTSVVLKCSIGQMGAAPAPNAKVVDSQIFVSAASQNGATFTTSVRSYGLAADGKTTTARPDGPATFGPFEITASPRYDIEKNPARVFGPVLVDINGGKQLGYKLEYNVQITTDRKVGVEAFKQPLTFVDSYWAGYNGTGQNGANGAVAPGFKWYMMDCRPFADSNYQGTDVVYGAPGVNTGATPTNSAANSGSCSYARTGDADTSNYTMTLSGIDTSGASYPTVDRGGKALPANKFIVASLEVSVFVPAASIDAMTGASNDNVGTVQFWNRVSGFDPVGTSGAPNRGGDGEPGYCPVEPNTAGMGSCADMPGGGRSNNVVGPQTITMSPGTAGKKYTNAIADWALDTRGVPNTTTDGTGQAMPGETYLSRITAQIPFGSDSFQACDVWDNSVLKLSDIRNDVTNGTPGPYAPPAGLYTGVISYPGTMTAAAALPGLNADQVHYVIKYGHVDLSADTPNNGTFSNADNRFEGNWTKQQAAANGGSACGPNSGITWVDDPNSLPGGIDEANVMWMQLAPGYAVPAGQGITVITGLMQRDTYYGTRAGQATAGQPIPEGTIAANFASVKLNAGTAWTGTKYIPGAGNTNGVAQPGQATDAFGDRWTLVRAKTSINKRTIAGTVDGTAATGVADFGKTGSATAGTPVIWQLTPAVTGSSGPNPPPVTNVTITDTLPAGVAYNAAATQAIAGNLAPNTVTVNADGTTKLVWIIPSATPNVAIAPIQIATTVDPLLKNNTSLTNAVNIKADGIIPVPIVPGNTGPHNAVHTITVLQPGSLALKKSVDHVLDLQDKDQVFTLQVQNFSETLPIQPPTIIDVLPYNGDATNPALVNRNPASKYVGKNTLHAVPTVTFADGKTPATGTFYYTTIDPALVPQDLNFDTDPTIWSTTFTPNATAFKFVADQPLAPINDAVASGLKLTFQTDQASNAAGNLYANRFTAFSRTFYNNNKYQLLTSNQVMVRVIGYSIGDLIWFDLDNDGKYTPGVDKAAPEGVTVNVYNASNTLVGTTTTNKDGRWVINDLPEGSYWAEIPGSQFAAGAPLAGYVAQTKGYAPDPNNNVNENGDHNGAPGTSGSVRTGLLTLKATVNADGTISGNAPMNDNTGNMPVTPGTTDDFTNFTLDMALKPVPGYTFTKSADPKSGTDVQAGSTITYTLTGVNTGKTSLDVSITDDLKNVAAYADVTTAPVATITGPGAGSAPAPTLTGTDLAWNGTLAVGQTVKVTYTVTVQKGHEGKIINNRANSTATPPGEPPITPPEVTTEHPIPGYELTKTADPVSGSSVRPGGTITYTVTGTNTGATKLDPVVINDDLSEVLNNASMTLAPVAVITGPNAPASTPAPTVSGTTMSWTGALEIGQKVTITYTVKLNLKTEGVVVNNKASSTATPPTSPPITPPDVTTEHKVPGYDFTKTSDPVSGTAVRPGDTITYTLSGVNTGATVLDPVKITDELKNVLNHADLTVNPVAVIEGPDAPAPADVPQPTISGTVVSWTGVLQVGQSVKITYTVTLHDDAEGVIVNNHASSSAQPPDEHPPIEPPDVETHHPTPGYTFFKAADPVSGTPVVADDVITYTLTGTNFGQTVLEPVEITDDLSKVLSFADMQGAPVAQIITDGVAADAPTQPTMSGAKLEWSGTLQIGQQVVITYKVKVQAGHEGETLNNFAESTATPPTGPPITPPPGKTEHPIPGYEVTKSADPKSGSTVQPGSSITYTVTGTNTGATILDPVEITDDMSAVLNHAVLVGTPKAEIVDADGGVTPASDPKLTGTTLSWSGTLQIGEKVRLVYVVKVNADAFGVTINNRVTSTAYPPVVPPITPPPVTTTHKTPPPTVTPPMAITGSPIQTGAIALGVLLLLAGAVTLAIRRRKRDA